MVVVTLVGRRRQRCQRPETTASLSHLPEGGNRSVVRLLLSSCRAADRRRRRADLEENRHLLAALYRRRPHGKAHDMIHRPYESQTPHPFQHHMEGSPQARSPQIGMHRSVTQTDLLLLESPPSFARRPSPHDDDDIWRVLLLTASDIVRLTSFFPPRCLIQFTIQDDNLLLSSTSNKACW